jgi:formate--tetrahydrofolate ligase
VTSPRRAQVGERRSGFDITAASEIMAILCLADSLADLRARLDRIVVGFTTAGVPVRASEFRATGALHGAAARRACSRTSCRRSRACRPSSTAGPSPTSPTAATPSSRPGMALAHADFVVTEGGLRLRPRRREVHRHQVPPKSGLSPDAIVLVATVRALKLHGGADPKELTKPDFAALERGLGNLEAHVTAARNFGRPVTVALNRFPSDTPDELARVHAFCASLGVACAHSEVFARGGDGGVELAEAVLASLPAQVPPLVPTYPDDLPVKEKMERIARRFYGADGVDLLPEAEAKLSLLELAGFGRLPICMAKTQNSLTDDPEKVGRPQGFRITVRDFELAAGAGFIVALTGQMMRMPALPKVPAAEGIDVDATGAITGISGT